MTKNQNKNYLWGLAALASAVAALTLLVWSPPVLKSQAALASYFEISNSTTASGTDNTLTMNVGDIEPVYLLLDTNTEYITAADVEITYNSTYLSITNSSGTAVTSTNVSTGNTAFTSVGSYAENAVTAVGSGSTITLGWGANTDETYQTASAADVFASFYIEANAETTTATTLSFTFTAGEDNTDDTDATRSSGTGGTTIDTLADCYNLSVTVNSALDMSVSKEADDEVYEYDPDDTTDIDYTITVSNDDTADSTVDFEDDIGDVLDDFFNGLDSSDIDDVRQDLVDSVDLSPSTAASATDIDDTDSDLDDGTFDIADLTVADGDDVTISYTLTLPEDLELDSFDWEEEDRYGDDINDEDLDNSDYDDEDEALGEPDGEWVSLGEDGEIVIELPDDMYIVNGDDEDVRVYEIDDEEVDTDIDDEEYEVSFSATCSSSFQDADNEESDSADFDLDDTNLDYARCIKITDTSNGDGDAPGVDIDAIAVLNVGRIIGNTATVTASNDETVSGTSTIVVDLTSLFEEDVPEIEETTTTDDEVPPPPIVSSLALSCTPEVLSVGATGSCTALFTDATTSTVTDVSLNPATIWTSDNLSVLSLNGRQYTGLTPGAAYVSATYNGYTAAALITVTAASLPVTGSGLNAVLVLVAVVTSLLAYNLKLKAQKN